MIDGLRPGVKLYGYCNGFFGRDSYETKTVIACGEWGRMTWLVASTELGGLETLAKNTDHLANWITNWFTPEEE